MKQNGDKTEFHIIGNTCQRIYMLSNNINMYNAEVNSTKKSSNVDVI